MKRQLLSLAVCLMATVAAAETVTLLAGDYPDPTVLKDGGDYYMTHSPFYYAPGFLIWHSTNLLDWEPLCRAVPQYQGSAMAPDLVKHQGRYYLYWPAAGTNWVSWADDIRGPWSDPIDLKIGGIDPGHVVDAEGNRWLYVDNGYMAPLSADGLGVMGLKTRVYEGWEYPTEWVTECMCLESPKLLNYNGYYYLISAQGGTAGPATSHMAIVARSESATGPWENSPYNPLVHTYDAADPWWSRGHGTLVEGPDGQWWIMYHAYARGFHTLGRSTVMEPVDWTADGWPRLSRRETALSASHSLALSDNFMSSQLGLQWTGWHENPTANITTGNGSLTMEAKGKTPADGRHLLTTAQDYAYIIEATVDAPRDAEGGLLLFYDNSAYIGVTTSADGMNVWLNADSCQWCRRDGTGAVRLRIVNSNNIVSIQAAEAAEAWTTVADEIDVSALNHNELGGFYALRPGLVACGSGQVAFSEFSYTPCYVNPVECADYSDPDVVAAPDGSGFYMTASSFNAVPGLPILHSVDLVNWEIVNYALPRLTPENHFAEVRHGKGVWAPSIRCHDGQYYIYWGDPDFGIYMVKAADPAGEWSEPILVKEGRGLIDPCPLWDDDGRAYLVHAWAASRAGFNSVLTMWEMTPDGTRLKGSPRIVFDGNDGVNHTVEGPKLYKRAGWYWILCPAGGVDKGWQLAMRSRSVTGPYEAMTVLSQGTTAINGPHQGGMVDDVDGKSWFLHFQESQPWGRVVHLNPVDWSSEWPVMGNAGEPVSINTFPAISAKSEMAVDANRFGLPGLDWQWQANPQGESGMLLPDGSMRIYGHIMPADQPNLWTVPNMMLRKFRGRGFTVTTQLRMTARRIGQQCGLIMMGLDYGRLSLERTADGFALSAVVCCDAESGSDEQRFESVALTPTRSYEAGLTPNTECEVWLRCDVDADGVCRFAYSTDGAMFTPMASTFQACEGKWVGAKTGVYAVSPDSTDRGWVDVIGFSMDSN